MQLSISKLRTFVPENFYRPQRSWAKVIFLQACVCPQGGGLPQCMLVCKPPPLGADPPGTRPPGTRPPPWEQTPRDGDFSIRSTSGRYASHWNAFLFMTVVQDQPIKRLTEMSILCCWLFMKKSNMILEKKINV